MLLGAVIINDINQLIVDVKISNQVSVFKLLTLHIGSNLLNWGRHDMCRDFFFTIYLKQ